MIYRTIILIRTIFIDGFWFKIEIKKTFLFGLQISYKETILF
jgi:hypothetical protein